MPFPEAPNLLIDRKTPRAPPKTTNPSLLLLLLGRTVATGTTQAPPLLAQVANRAREAHDPRARAARIDVGLEAVAGAVVHHGILLFLTQAHAAVLAGRVVLSQNGGCRHLLLLRGRVGSGQVLPEAVEGGLLLWLDGRGGHRHGRGAGGRGEGVVWLLMLLMLGLVEQLHGVFCVGSEIRTRCF